MLSKYFEVHPKEVQALRVLDLSAGTGLVGNVLPALCAPTKYSTGVSETDATK